jgi:CHAT domain-containing protein
MVVSYTPAVKIMGNCIKKATRSLSKKTLRALLVAVPESFGMDALPEAMNEIEAISQLLPPGRRINSPHMNEKDGLSSRRGATVDDVLSHLSEADILHLACHGRSEEFSFDTGFLMTDRVLRVADLCETAKPGRSVHHSAMHLASTLLYAGFHSVIGTMWTMGDIDGVQVSLEVYNAMLAGDGDKVDLNVVPYALDTAIRNLREGGVSSDRWATYMHFGV